METLLATLRQIRDDPEIDWSLFFYKKRKTSRQNPFLTYSWTINDGLQFHALISDIVNTILNKYSQDEYTIRDYTPNNDKFIIDKTQTTSRLISDVYNDLIQALADSTAYSKDVGKVNGYIIKGVKRTDDENLNYFFIGIGAPVKVYKHAFANQSVMEEVHKEFINIKPFYDVFVSNTDCYLDGSYSHSFFDLLTFHKANMDHAHAHIEATNLVINLPDIYPKRGKSIFTDLMNYNTNVKAAISFYIDQKNADPDNEHFGALKIVDGKIDASDLECYLTLIDLLSGRINSEGVWQGEVRPINVRFLPPQIDHHAQSR